MVFYAIYPRYAQRIKYAPCTVHQFTPQLYHTPIYPTHLPHTIYPTQIYPTAFTSHQFTPQPYYTHKFTPLNYPAPFTP